MCYEHESDSQCSVVHCDGVFVSRHVTHERAIETACYADSNKCTTHSKVI
jgi:hypothetical protein